MYQEVIITQDRIAKQMLKLFLLAEFLSTCVPSRQWSFPFELMDPGSVGSSRSSAALCRVFKIAIEAQVDISFKQPRVDPDLEHRYDRVNGSLGWLF
ncbi:hypothetical protein GWK47_035655 [Chionoecetes opilio]|uniref:Uncharacterized protein n=1 Tax=Chionoecetes opilio TaxID=41210 RepID=A0A8J4YGM5_CHIOP|nr:hypothetical protein GWK47_035655 [Chionoecetes opilio]